jgi:tRNA pseudouridine38-40 synthase
MKHLYKLTISYDGSNYSGWQIQPNSICVQELIQSALQTVLREKTTLTGSGRTDAGVHALGQIAHFSLEDTINIKKTINSLNGILPKDIRIEKIEEKETTFHSRFNTISKTYKYYLTIGNYQSPFDRKYSFHCKEQLDLDLLKKAARYFIGTHDFTSFANKHLEGRASTNPIRTIKKLDIYEVENNKICFEFLGDGFLYKMVRNIVGTLLDISTGKININELSNIFTAKKRQKAGKTAPAKGLFLVKVDYKKSDGISNKELK